MRGFQKVHEKYLLFKNYMVVIYPCIYLRDRETEREILKYWLIPQLPAHARTEAG